MVIMVRRLLALLPLLVTAVAAGDDRLVLDSRASEDSDGLRQQSFYAGAVKALPALGREAGTGMRAGWWRLEGAGDGIEFTGLRVDHRQSLGGGELALGLHQLFGEAWSPTLGHAAVVVKSAAAWSLDVGVDRELVDTVVAARRETTLDAWHLIADCALSPEWLLVGGPQRQDFSDGNRRQGGLLKTVWSPATLPGFNAQLRLRRLDAAFRGVGYFSPDRFEEALALAQYSRPVLDERLVLGVQFGAGQQRIDGGAGDGVYVAELRARGWLTDAFGLEGRARCSNTGEVVVTSAAAGYRYCQVDLSLMRPW